jgi:hypothetical protein
LPKSRATPARRRPAHNPQEEADYVYNLLALLGRLDKDDLLDETAPACPLFCQARAQEFLDEVTEEAALSSFNLSNVRPSLASQKLSMFRYPRSDKP